MKPKQYVQGYAEFYKLKFKLTPDVLIPRPETELLIDEVLYFLRTTNYGLPTILDMGTGCGNIAISVAKNTKTAKIIATDISKSALKVAAQNAKLHGVKNRIKFIKSDLLSGINYTLTPIPYTLIIIANLPYIPSERIPYLDSSVKDFEPKIALDGGPDGFELYRKLFSQISQQPRRLQPKLIVCEIDYTHGELAVIEAQRFFPEAKVEVKTDLAKKQRILKIYYY